MRGTTERIFNYLSSRKEGITSKEAFEKFGTISLNRIIFRMREAGLNIESIPEKGVNRYGDPVHFVRYVLHKS